jgi:hypothetical protein
MNQWQQLASTQFRPILQFSAYQPILAKSQRRLILRREVVKDIDGHPSWKGDFKFMQKLAKKNGLIWGGDWGKPSVKPKLYDAVHVQRCTVARQKALFNGTWYPDDNYDPYK